MHNPMTNNQFGHKSILYFRDSPIGIDLAEAFFLLDHRSNILF